MKQSWQLTHWQRISIITLFLFFSIILVMHHEAWRDEANPWLLARDSLSFSDTLSNLKYEAHPFLWYGIAYALSHIGLPYISLSFFHVLISLASVVLIVYVSPFNWWQKTVLPFGYFFLFEYNIIARNYALIVFFLFCLATLYKKRMQHPLCYTLLLLFLANTHVEGFILSVVIGGVFLAELAIKKGVAAIIPALISVVGVGITIMQIIPPSDAHPIMTQWHTSPIHLFSVFSAFSHGFFPFFAPNNPHFWSDWWTITSFSTTIGFFMLCMSPFFFIKKRIPLLLYVFGISGLSLLFFLKYDGTIRHHGILFIYFLFILWIGSYYPDNNKNIKTNTQTTLRDLLLPCILAITLVTQVYGGILAAYYEIRYGFSGSKATAQYLEKNNLTDTDTLLVGYPAYATSSIIPYFKSRSTIFYPEIRKEQSFYLMTQDLYAHSNLPLDDLVRTITQEAETKRYRQSILILGTDKNNELINLSSFTSTFQPLGCIPENGIVLVGDESFCIYRRK